MKGSLTGLLILFILLVNSGQARYTLQIRAVNYYNPNNQDWDGGCCDYGFFSCGTCDVYFRFCIRAAGSDARNAHGCWASMQTSNDITTNNYNFPTSGELYSGAGVYNPMTFSRNEAWPGSIQVLVVIDDSDPDADDLIDRVAFNINRSPTGTWSDSIHSNGYYGKAQFKVQVLLSCQPNYYTSSCSVYCVPQNDNTNGHYDCSSQGEKICKNGYTNPSGNCLTPICSVGCSAQNGYCNIPNECKCNTGWTGGNCNECIPKTGCSTNHGSCNQPGECNCEIGYGGSLCTEDHDVCGHQQPCVNKATCTNVIPDSYQCNCTPGYTGNNCQIEINECDSDPCKNGAFCIDQVNGYSCRCTSGWTDPQCETNIDDCISNPCQNNGTCNDLVNGYNCSCEVGYFGLQCEGHHCDSSPCNNSGTCVGLTDGYKCDCISGYTGNNCNSEINECDPSPCKNGTCKDLLANYQCTCIPGFTGKDCQFNIDDCIGAKCGPHSICLDGINSYICICDFGYTGEFCDIVITYCDSQPCFNGSTCNDYIGYYTCQCQEGYNGTNCSINIDDCEPDPCLNGSTCIDLVRGFQCICPTGLTGLTCDTRISACDANPCSDPTECVDDFNSTKGYYCRLCLEGICRIVGDETTPTPNPNVASSTNDWGPYVGVAIGVTLLLSCLVCLICICCCYCCKRRKKSVSDAILISPSGQMSVTDNPTYIPPNVLVTSQGSTIRRPQSPNYVTLESGVDNPTPLRNDHKKLTKSDDTEDQSLQNRIRRSVVFMQSGYYDRLDKNNTDGENLYVTEPTNDLPVILPTRGITEENPYKGTLDEDSFPFLQDVDLTNPYETIPGENNELKTPYVMLPASEENPYETIPASIDQEINIYETLSTTRDDI